MRLLKKSGEYYLIQNQEDSDKPLDELILQKKLIASTRDDMDLLRMSKPQIESMIGKMDLETISKSKMLDTKLDFPFKNYYQVGFLDGYYQAIKDINRKDNSSWKVKIKTDPIYQEPIVEGDGLLSIIEIVH